MNPLVGAVAGSVLGTVGKLLERLIPDPVERAKYELAAAEAERRNELAPIMAQLEINKIEAAHQNMFIAGGRPAAIWVGVAGFAYAGLLHPIFSWLSVIQGWPVPPQVDTDILFYVLGGLLGLGGLRTYEKVKGVA